MGVVRRHPLVSVLSLAVLVALGILLATAVAVWRAAHTDDASRIDHADVILVLGAAEYNGRPSPVFVGRLRQAELLFRQDRGDEVVVLGGSKPGDVTTEAAAGRNYLIGRGLPPASVSAEPRGSDTYESLQAAARYMRGRDLHSAFLVSDPWHNLRIKKMASDLGIRAYASATWHSAATSEGTRMSGYVRETFAYLYYRVFGGH
ncbi:MAG: YdcF family protein [Actinomycetota bacterium]